MHGMLPAKDLRRKLQRWIWTRDEKFALLRCKLHELPCVRTLRLSLPGLEMTYLGKEKGESVGHATTHTGFRPKIAT